jgi:hypothetical protein
VVRVVWADVRDGSTGTIRAARLREWVDEDHLAVEAPGWAQEASVAYERLMSVGLRGDRATVLWQPRALLHGPVMSPSGKLVAALAWTGQGESVYLYDPGAKQGRFLAERQVTGLSALAWTGEDTLLLTGDAEGKLAYWLVGTHSGAVTRTDAPPPAHAYQGKSRFVCQSGDLYESPEGSQEGGPLGLRPGGGEPAGSLTSFTLAPDSAPVPPEVSGR